MKIFRPGLIVTVIIFSFNLLFAQKQIIINELSQGPHDDWEWIELVVLKDSTDIRGVYIDDNDPIHGTFGSAKLVQLKKDLPEFASVKRGSIIVIYKSTDSTWLNGQDPKLFEAGAPDTDFSDSVLIIPHTDTTYLEKGSWWPAFLSTSQNVGIFDSSGSGIFGISYGWEAEPVGGFSEGWGMVNLVAIHYGFVAWYYGTNGANAKDSTYWIFGGATLGTPGAFNLFQDAIPVELTSFSVSNLNNGVQLRWETATEINNYGFDIQRSDNLSTWNKVGYVPGHGTTTETQKYQFVDSDIKNSDTYYYRLKQIDYNGNSKYSKVLQIGSNTVVEFELKQNYPNPFNPATTINFSIEKHSPVSLIVYNVVGEKIKTLFDGIAEPGNYSYYFDGSEFASGTYIYQLKTDNIVQTKKMLLLK